MKRTYLTNCTLVLPSETLAGGSLLIEGEEIAAICPASVGGAFVETDLGGATLMPGMIDLHSDYIESIAEPRSGIYLPFDLAISQLDRIAAGNGITTFYNAISFAGEELGLRKEDAPARMVRAVRDYRPSALIDQRVHCRYEVSVADALPCILDFIREGSCEFVSYMDHSPGQGQFQDEANYRSYMTARYGYDDDEITKLLESKLLMNADYEGSRQRVNQLAATSQSANIPFAGHDADSAAHVAEMIALGAVLAEFPMSQEAADAGKQAGMHQCVGGVNVIRGGSQRTGMSALKLIETGHADCLCSDYVPGTLLPAVLKIVNELERPLHEIAKVVTSNPAKAAGLTDRGALKVGLKADLFSFHANGGSQLPLVQTTWFHGRAVYSTHDHRSRDAAASINNKLVIGAK